MWLWWTIIYAALTSIPKTRGTPRATFDRLSIMTFDLIKLLSKNILGTYQKNMLSIVDRGAVGRCHCYAKTCSISLHRRADNPCDLYCRPPVARASVVLCRTTIPSAEKIVRDEGKFENFIQLFTCYRSSRFHERPSQFFDKYRLLGIARRTAQYIDSDKQF